jgi:VWFA-related protein
MQRDRWIIGLPLTLALFATCGAAQRVPTLPKIAAPEEVPAEHVIHIDVQVDTKKGAPVDGLSQADFTLLDNKQDRTIRSFREVNRKDQPVEAILVFDAVNTRYENVAYERLQVDKFLKDSGQKLEIPMQLAVLTDKGLQVEKGFTQDPSALTNMVENSVIELRQITRAAGFWGADERLDTSLQAMQQLVQYSAGLPGRKLILFVSPGWPLLSGPEVELDPKQQKQIFSSVVTFSRAMRRGDVTIDSIDPLGPGESLLREDYYQSFLGAIRKPSDTDLADLSVQVLSLQSGGLVLNSSDIEGVIRRCLSDADGWYEITFDAPPAEKPNEYHHLEIKLNKPGLIARTRDGYYDQPVQDQPAQAKDHPSH